MNFQDLRKKHRQFIFESFEILPEEGNLKIYFNFTITPDIKFRPEIIFPNIFKNRLDEIRGYLKNLVFHLGMIELISYWKCACPPEIIIKLGFLNENQINWWKNLLIKGLGEFFYTNKIDFTIPDLIAFVVKADKQDYPLFNDGLSDRDLLLVGGGKDSAVTLDIISQSERDFNCLMLNPNEAALSISEKGGCGDPIIISRTIDPKLLELNKQGYLNGHTPFSAYLAFLSTLAAVIYDYKNIIVSNEASSNEANIKWKGLEINHQYSKTSQFEKDFRNYSKKYLTISTNYFSFLRDKGAIEIAEIFSKMPKYHKLFRSCNRGSKENVWCGKCAKCVSTYLILYPFLGRKVEKIFGKNLLDDESLITVVESVLGKKMAKPFDCVATRDEIKNAIALGIKKAKKDGQKIPRVLQRFEI